MPEPAVCPHCAKPMDATGSLFLCGPGGRARMVPLAPTCQDAACRAERDTAAIEAAIAAGIVRRAGSGNFW
jgi:hypothetical protein